MNNDKRRWLLLPIETKVREFESRILLGCVAAKSGYGVILGSLKNIDAALEQLPRGIYLSKDAHTANYEIERMQKRLNLGYIYTCLDEEGLETLKGSLYLKRRVSDLAIQRSALYFTWGLQQAEAICDVCPNAAGKLVASGNPRIDLLRPELAEVHQEKSDRIRNQYGKYLLIISNFGEALNPIGTDFVVEQGKSTGVLNTEDEIAEEKERVAYSHQNYLRFVDVFAELSRTFSTHMIIIRPHPSDNPKYWEKAIQPFANMRIADIDTGSATAWIKGADAIIHHGCTTGVEAYVLGVPTISYLPYRQEKYEYHLSNYVSTKVYTIDALIEAIQHACDSKHTPSPEAKTYIDRQLSSVTGSLASEKIVQAIGRLELPLEELAYVANNSLLHNEDQQEKRTLLNQIKKMPGYEYIVRQLGYRKAIMPPEYAHRKFPGATLEEVNHFIERLQHASGRFDGVSVQQLDTDLFCILAD